MSPPAAPGEPQRLAAVPSGVDAASLYSQGYGQLLQRDYAGAEASFRALVQRFPADPLAGKAQYWLGESYYARGAFKDAADAFLASYRTYGSGEKAPDSLLKLAMALAALGEKDAACSTFAEFGAKYPSADAGSARPGQNRAPQGRLLMAAAVTANEARAALCRTCRLRPRCPCRVRRSRQRRTGLPRRTLARRGRRQA